MHYDASKSMGAALCGLLASALCGAVFCLVLTPVAILLRGIDRALARLRRGAAVSSYWIDSAP